jgi:hypothetical protein
MTDHKTATREEWLAARLELLEAEKVLTPFPCLDRPRWRGAKRVYAGTRQALVHTGRLTAARPEFIAHTQQSLGKAEVNHADIT